MRASAVALALALAVAPMMPSAKVTAAHSAVPTNSGVAGGSCSFTKRDYAAANSLDESTSENFVSLKDAGAITFTQSRSGCVAGTFFANAGNAGAGDHVGLQVLLDGVACAPLANGYIFADTNYSSHSVGFFCGAGIAPGKHTVEVQYRSGFGGNVQFFQRTLEVDHS